MPASSVSTYLDVTQAARPPASAAPAPEQGPIATDAAAKVLAAIHAGENVVAGLPEKTGLSTEAVVSAIAWLSEANLVVVDSSDETLRARLTDAAKAALEP